MVLPIVVLLLLATLQAAILVRDRILLINATRAAARAVVVSPNVETAREAIVAQGGVTDDATVTIDGETTAGGLATVTLRMPATQVPVVGKVVSGVELSESLTVRVEGLG